MLSIFTCLTCLHFCISRNSFSISVHVFRRNSLRKVSRWIKRRTLICKNVLLYSRLIPCVKRQSSVAAEHGTRTRNHHKLTGNVRQPSSIIWFHILKICRNIHRIDLFLHLLQLGSELLNCLLIFSQLLHWDFIYSKFLRSLNLSHFVHISDLRISENFFFHRQFLL